MPVSCRSFPSAEPLLTLVQLASEYVYRDVSDLMLAKISTLVSQDSVDNSVHKDTESISAEAQEVRSLICSPVFGPQQYWETPILLQKADLNLLERITKARNSEKEVHLLPKLYQGHFALWRWVR